MTARLPDRSDDSLPSGATPAGVRALLRAEGALACVLALYAYHRLGAPWGRFALLVLLPDLSMLGYLAGPRVGAALYNLGHSTVTVAVACGLAGWAGAAWAMPVAAVWVAHIGFDRALGYGLKYRQGFRATHLSPR